MFLCRHIPTIRDDFHDISHYLSHDTRNNISSDNYHNFSYHIYHNISNEIFTSKGFQNGSKNEYI